MDTKQNAVGGVEAPDFKPPVSTSENANGNQAVREDHLHPEQLDNRSSAEIKHRIDRTRGAMDETLNQLGERLSPHSLLDDVMDWFKSSTAKSSARQVKSSVEVFGKNLGCQLRDNPVPALLVGAGLAWLAFGSNRDEEDGEDEDRLLAYADDHEFTTEEELLIGGYAAAARANPLQGSSSSKPGLYLPGSAAESNDDGGGVFDKAKRAGWSVASSIQGAASSTAHTLQDAASTVGEKLSDAASATAHGVRGAAASVGSAFSSATSATNDAASRGYSKTRSAARSAYRGSARTGQRAGQEVQQLGRKGSQHMTEAYELGREKFRIAHEDYPLALGFGFLALGALAGLVIPRTRREDQLLGESADQLKHTAWEAGEQAVERGQEAVDNTVRAARDAAAEQGLTADSLVNSASRVIEKTAETLDTAAKEEGIHPQNLAEQGKEVAEKTQQTAKKEASL